MKDENNSKKNSNEKKSSVKQLIAGSLLIISTVCLTVSAVYLYDTYKESKKKTDAYVSSIQNTVNKGESDDINNNPNKELNQEGDLNKETDVEKEVDSETNPNENQVGQEGLSVDGNQTDNIDKEQVATDIDEIPDVKKVPPCKVKGIYVTGQMAGTTNNMNNLIDLVDTTELNTMVIDIKNDSGEITYKMDNELAKEIGATFKYISNIEELVAKLKEKGIYLIARVVAFKDPILAENKPELSLKNADGTIFRDKSNLAWVNPYKKEVWEYLVSVSKEAANLGFDEIQFDYIRFSTDSGMKQVSFGEEAKDKSKIEVITEFTKYACEELQPLGVYVSADVYGTIINSEVDAKIVGQSYVEMSKYLDYICPMIYPSHYANGAYGINYPDLEPYLLIKKALDDSKKVLVVGEEGEHQAIVRPWLQDFTATWIKQHKKYGANEIKEQIKGVYDAGYEEWILWNGSNRYTKDGLEK
ncbi:putative glycoside hydrolase [Anaerosporobacter sp.]|uniref:putative glycoside hydrolase n=1 Tax=Anaerosporobacter sp. TaxID=1872529 RepID=UPI00286F7F1B|nr:putative glycoside hydrolase [Anaerosporobacter sp.]